MCVFQPAAFLKECLSTFCLIAHRLAIIMQAQKVAYGVVGDLHAKKVLGWL